MSSVEYLGNGKPINKVSPLVSVCIPTFQHASYIAECLDSVLSQETSFQIEILVGEDKSSDETRDICIAYADKFPEKIRLFLNDREDIIFIAGEATGRANIINLFSEARGKFIALCDGDDYWTDNRKLMLQVECLEKNEKVDIVFHPCMLINKSETETQGPFRVQSSHDTVIDINKVIAGGGGFMPSPSLFFRNHVVELIPTQLFRNSPPGDYLIQIYGSLRGGAGYINSPMCVYRVGHPVSWSNSLKNPDKLIRVQTGIYEMVKEVEHDLNDFSSAFSEFIFNQYSAQAYSAYLACNGASLGVSLKILQDRKNQLPLKQKLVVSLISLKFSRIVFYTFRQIVHFLIRIRQAILGR